MKDEVIAVKAPPKDIKCKTCLFSGGNVFSYNCCKFKFKPNEVFYEGKDCPKYEFLEEDDDGE